MLLKPWRCSRCNRPDMSDCDLMTVARALQAASVGSVHGCGRVLAPGARPCSCAHVPGHGFLCGHELKAGASPHCSGHCLKLWRSERCTKFWLCKKRESYLVCSSLIPPCYHLDTLSVYCSSKTFLSLIASDSSLPAHVWDHAAPQKRPGMWANILHCTSSSPTMHMHHSCSADAKAACYGC